MPHAHTDELAESGTALSEVCGDSLLPVEGCGSLVPPDGLPHTIEFCSGADKRVCKQRKPILFGSALDVKHKSLTGNGSRKL